MPPLLRVNDLSIAIRRGTVDYTVVDKLSFTINEGEIVGIVGESGCGKSLTALSLLGLLPDVAHITGGQLIFDGEDINKMTVSELVLFRGAKASMIFQEPMTSLNPLTKIGRQVTEPLLLHGSKDKRQNKQIGLDVMARVGLPQPEKLWDMYPHQLSGGMRQRVMIAMAIILNPKLLIADEPTTALDVTVQAQILKLIKQLNIEIGLSVLFISHDLEVIGKLADRMLVMYTGNLVEDGAVSDIFAYPAHEYTKGLLGSTPTRAQKGKPLVSIGGKIPSITEPRQPCPFAPRCSKVRDICLKQAPQNTAVGENHNVRCHMADSERG